MPEDLGRLPTKELTKEEVRANHALAGLLDNLEETCRWIRDLDRERAEAMAKRSHLRQSIEPLLRATTYEVARRHRPRYDELSIDSRTRPRALSGPLRRVMAFLSEFEFTTVRAADIMHYLKMLKVDVNPKYASKALYDLERDGIVTRSGHGKFTVNHTHPDIVAVRMERVGRRPSL